MNDLLELTGLIELLLCLLSMAALGALVGFFGALLGLGGGFIMVPALILLVGFDAHHAVGTSMVAVFFTGSSSALAYYWQRRLDWKLALIAETSTMPGAFMGAMLTCFISSANLKTLFSLLLTGLALSVLFRKRASKHENRHEIGFHEKRFSWRRKVVDSGGKVFNYSIDVLKLLPACFLAGIVSGFFGIGGGTIKVPVLYHLGAPIHIAVATSTLMIALTALSGAIGHLTLGHVRSLELLGLIPGILVGTRFGALAARKARSATLRKAFSSALIVMAILLLIR